MADDLIERIQRAAGVPDLVDVLASRLEPTDLQSLLLEVYRRRAAAVTPARVLEQYRANRFVAPSPVDPRAVTELDAAAWSLLPSGYVPLELAPVCPLGSNSAVATVDQNKVLSTIRNTEVVADPTNVLALECAARRRRLAGTDRRREPVLLAASQRVVRAQAFEGPRTYAHFRLLCLCAAGRDEGAFRFETVRVLEQLAFYLGLLEELARRGWPLVRFRVALTLLSGPASAAPFEEQVLAPLAARFATATCQLDPERTSGRGYYRDVCFKLFASDAAGTEWEVGDGGMTPWTQLLLSDRKERLLVSGLAAERVCGR